MEAPANGGLHLLQKGKSKDESIVGSGPDTSAQQCGKYEMKEGKALDFLYCLREEQ